MEVSPAVRYAALGLIVLCAIGLGWRGVTIYQADQRAQRAALLAQSHGGESAPPGDAEEGPSSGPVKPGEGAASGTSEAAPVAPPEPVKPQLVVHVEGAVRKPGVYILEEGARVNDAIQAAGGPLAEGVPGALNLAAPLIDGAKIYVYTRAELQPGAPVAATAREATYAPVQTAAAPQPPAQNAGPAGGRPGQPVLVNVNRASAAELERVPGIGPVTARAIVAYRTKHGAFKRIEDLTAVSGIGPKTLEKLRPYLQV